jgi:hypothetical protein
MILLLLLCCAAVSGQVDGTLFPREVAASIGNSPCLLSAGRQVDELIESKDMLARTAVTFLDVPFELFAAYLMSPMLLPTWNADYSDGGTDAKLTPCTKFTAHFTTKINVTVPNGFTFKPPLVLTVNRTSDVALFGWDFGVSDNAGNNFYYGAHWIGAFRVSVNEQPVVKFISWEKITSGQGNTFVADNRAAFEFGMSKTVLQPDLVGAMCIERVYATTGSLVPADVQRMCGAALRK